MARCLLKHRHSESGFICPGEDIMVRKAFLKILIVLLIGVFAEAAEQQPDAAKGDRLLKAMSRKLEAAASFSFNTVEVRDQLDRRGKPVHIEATRDTVVRRPNSFWTKFTGDRDWEIWYDGKQLTAVTAEKKAYIQAEMPPTLDETMDLLAVKYNLDLPMSDVLYSSPYQAFMDEQTKGGFTGTEKINGATCNRLSYSSPTADWRLWVDDRTSLPCRLEMTYKKQAAKTSFVITFRDWNLSPQIREGTFAFRVPEDYARIPILQRTGAPAPQTQTSPTGKQ